MRISTLILAGSALALGGCAYGDLGLGYGSPYYGSSYGYGYGGYPYYGSSYYGGYGYGYPYYGSYGYGSPYFGWYDNYYYPGTGYYVYDVNRRPYAMTSSQRTYWMSRQPRTATTSGTTTVRTVQPNWSAFNNRQARAEKRAQRQADRDQRDITRPR